MYLSYWHGFFKRRVVKDRNMKAILIVDDDETSRLYVELMVKKTGVNILKADNGLEAVEKVKAGYEIDVILMDMNMPVMDGFEATKIIKSLNKKIPVIALTSLSLAIQKKRMKDAGCDVIINKPVNAEVLHRAIRESLNSENCNPGLKT